MKRMIDNKEFEALKNDVKDVEAHTTDYVITSVVVEENKVLGSQVKDVENDVTYNLPLGSQVEANPELEGTEDALESVRIDGTNYSIGGGKQLYQHNLHLSGANIEIYCQIINDNDTPFNTLLSLSQWLYSKGLYYGSSPHYRNSLQASGINNDYFIIGIQDNGNNNGQIYGVGETNSSLTLTSVKDTIITL